MFSIFVFFLVYTIKNIILLPLLNIGFLINWSDLPDQGVAAWKRGQCLGKIHQQTGWSHSQIKRKIPRFERNDIGIPESRKVLKRK